MSLTGFICLRFFDYFGFNRQFKAGAPQSLHRLIPRNTVHFEKDSPGLDRHDVSFNIAFSASQGHLGRKLRNRLIGENPNPNLAAALQGVRNRFSRSLNLFAVHPSRRAGLKAETAEAQIKPAGFDHSLPRTALLLLAMLLFFGLKKHIVGLIGFVGFVFFVENFALIEPDLDADRAISVESRRFAVIDERAERLERHFALR